MVTKLIKIGNSFGVRIPKVIIKEMELGNEVELKLMNDFLAIIPIKAPRSNWSMMFETLAVDEPSPVSDFPNEFDSKEWDW